MQFKKTIFCGLVSIMISPLANANIIIHGLSANGEDFCRMANGHWAGDATATIVGAPKDCIYHADSLVTGSDPTHLDVSISIDKKSGSLVCPKHESLTLSGQCQNNTLVINTDDNSAHFDGEFVDMNTVNLSGTVNVSGINATIKHLQMTRQ